MDWQSLLGFNPSAIGIGGSGWIPPQERDNEMKAVDDAVKSLMPSFGDVNAGDDLPNEALLCDLEIKAIGKIVQVRQWSGSCVGAGATKAYLQAAAGDAVVRGDAEQVKFCFPWATYGMGRKLGGMNRTGEGSFGTAQARAVREWGMLPSDDPRFPQPNESSLTAGWLSYSERIEIAWSHPSNWPISENELYRDAQNYQILDTAQVRSTTEVRKALSQGYGVTLASMFGTRNERVNDGYLIGDWNDRWAHQMSCGGYSTHPSLGIVFWIQNQWGSAAHPVCPKMSAKGVVGGFWITERNMAEIIRTGEVFIHSNTEGFPVRKIDWGSMGIV